MNAASVLAAWSQATGAAAAAGITIREVHEIDQLVVVRRLLDTVWNADPSNPAATAELLRAYAHTGQYVVLAEDLRGGGVLAASVGFLAAPIGRALHSNITGVLPAGLGRSVGFAIKLHQRAWALSHGLDLVTWTFDPLIRRNAWFNLAKLAARPVEYLDNFYGSMADGRNAGDESDRLYLEWDLLDPAVDGACSGTPVVADVAGALRSGGHVLLSVADDGGPTAHDPPGSKTGPLLLQIPADIEKLRAEDPRSARSWRAAVRTALGGALSTGSAISGMGRDGWYVLEAAPPDHVARSAPDAALTHMASTEAVPKQPDHPRPLKERA